jgi:N-acetylglucosaminyldiphosphoundecaprenol N-acetyl-beta-D-mannosaminyltransferase
MTDTKSLPNSLLAPGFQTVSAINGSRVLPGFQVLGVRVDAVQLSDTVAQLRRWIDDRGSTTRFVAVTGMHGIAESRESSDFRRVLNAADLVVPDGMPLVWVGRTKGHRLPHRVCGSELMDDFCRVSGNSYRHFFYGGVPGVAEQLADMLHRKYGIVVAGTYSPPFRSLTEDEQNDFAARLEQSAPDVLWVGLSTPKQETWMYHQRAKLRVPVMLGVGAAFDMNSGRSRRAPQWMRECGLEWLFRLLQEPRRLGRRYLISIPKAAWFVGLELLQSSVLNSGPGSQARSTSANSTEESTAP